MMSYLGEELQALRDNLLIGVFHDEASQMIVLSDQFFELKISSNPNNVRDGLVFVVDFSTPNVVQRASDFLGHVRDAIAHISDSNLLAKIVNGIDLLPPAKIISDKLIEYALKQDQIGVLHCDTINGSHYIKMEFEIELGGGLLQKLFIYLVTPPTYSIFVSKPFEKSAHFLKKSPFQAAFFAETDNFYSQADAFMISEYNN